MNTFFSWALVYFFIHNVINVTLKRNLFQDHSRLVEIMIYHSEDNCLKMFDLASNQVYVETKGGPGMIFSSTILH